MLVPGEGEGAGLSPFAAPRSTVTFSLLHAKQDETTSAVQIEKED